MLLLVCGNCQGDVLKTPSVAETLASFSGSRTFKSCCSVETRMKLQEVINALNTAFVLFSYKYFYWNKVWQRRPAPRTAESGRTLFTTCQWYALESAQGRRDFNSCPFHFCLDAFPLTQCLPFILSSNGKQLG